MEAQEHEKPAYMFRRLQERKGVLLAKEDQALEDLLMGRCYPVP
jgi:hypothetical protein